MKRLLSFLLIFVFIFSFCACTEYDSSSYNDSSSSEKEETSHLISKSEAEELALSALYSKLVSVYTGPFEVSQTRYSVGSVTGSSSRGYTIKGKFSLYDKYGDYRATRKFSVEVDSDGFAKVTEY